MDKENIKEIGRLEPVIITIFGATGDLAQKKLFPALFEFTLIVILSSLGL